MPPPIRGRALAKRSPDELPESRLDRGGPPLVDRAERDGSIHAADPVPRGAEQSQTTDRRGEWPDSTDAPRRPHDRYLDDREMRDAQGDEEHLGVERPAGRSLLTEEVVRDLTREQLETALCVSIREPEQDAGRGAHHERHEPSDRRRAGRPLGFVVTPSDVDGVAVRRP